MAGSLFFALFLGFGGTIFWEAVDLRLRDVRDFRHLCPKCRSSATFRSSRTRSSSGNAPCGAPRCSGD